MDAAISKAHGLVNPGPGRYRFTDLTKTSLAGVRNPYFRLFVPVKYRRARLPTSLPEFRMLRHSAVLSDSPVTAAALLGGHWTDHNLAAITQVAACNFRCTYCYVDFRHLAGHDSRLASAENLVDEFVELSRRLADEGERLTILRISGGEPLLAPDLFTGIYQAMARRDLLGACLLKAESNLSAFRSSLLMLRPSARREFTRIAPHVTVHATIHAKPGERDWSNIKAGLSLAVELGIDLYPAIGGTGWTVEDMTCLADELEAVARGLAGRLAVRPFNWEYVERYPRPRRTVELEDDLTPSLRWDTILREKTGRSYLEKPRHTVTLG